MPHCIAPAPLHCAYAPHQRGLGQLRPDLCRRAADPARAELAGLPGHARQVGYALHALPSATALPWHRVINASGGVSLRASPGAELTQRQLLEEEGVEFDLGGRVRLAKVQWKRKR
jgi:methylated-DNA-protein-cysteine methyltransferase related protein